MNERERAFLVLEAIDTEGAYSHIALGKALHNQISKQDTDFIRHLVLGVLEKRGLLDYFIQKLSDKTAKRKVRQILRLALFQLLYMDRIPKHAVVDEAVQLCKKIAPQNSGYVNAVLRKADKAVLLAEDFSKLDPEYRLEVLYTLPPWLIKRWVRRFGLDQTEALLKELRHKPKLYMRVNPLRGSIESVCDQLTALGISWSETSFSALLEVKDLGQNALDHLELLKSGAVTIQDLAAYLVGEAMNPNAQDTVLDSCAAPGGKSSHLAELAPESQIVSTDIHPAKVDKMRESFIRRGYKNIECLVYDGQEYRAEWHQHFTQVLLDAPCSGLGIINRKPELPFHKKESDINSLSEIQQTLLDNLCQYVKPGGFLTYATCTIEPEENEDQVRSFLNRHPQYDLVDLNGRLPSNFVRAEGWVSLLPSSNHDGFFIAMFKKRESSLIP